MSLPTQSESLWTVSDNLAGMVPEKLQPCITTNTTTTSTPAPHHCQVGGGGAHYSGDGGMRCLCPALLPCVSEMRTTLSGGLRDTGGSASLCPDDGGTNAFPGHGRACVGPDGRHTRQHTHAPPSLPHSMTSPAKPQ